MFERFFLFEVFSKRSFTGCCEAKSLYSCNYNNVQTLFERFFYLKYFQSEALRDVAKKIPLLHVCEDQFLVGIITTTDLIKY